MNRVYEIITNRIIEKLEQGTVPWHKPWKAAGGAPRNLVSGKAYRGINAIVLASAGYASPYWVTYKQAKECGGHVRRGEKGWICLYWNWLEEVDKVTGETLKRPFVRYYTVFNVVQCEDLRSPEVRERESVFSPIGECERVVSAMRCAPQIEHTGERAVYNWLSDRVSMPARERFESPQHYYATLFHELAHSTGHESRLDRRSGRRCYGFGSESYAREELVAEMGSAFLCGEVGIESRVVDNSASYVQAWLQKLRNDKRLVIYAAGQAQRAADYILGKQWEEEKQEES